MKKLALTILVFAAFCSTCAAPLFIGYYPDWGKWHKPAYTVDKVPYEKLTHVLWSFITPNTDGTLRGDAADNPSALDEMVKLAHAVGTKVVVSLGGGGQSENFVPVSKDNTLRQSSQTLYNTSPTTISTDSTWTGNSIKFPSQNKTPQLTANCSRNSAKRSPKTKASQQHSPARPITGNGSLPKSSSKIWTGSDS